jgi:hypothetical protein
MSSNQANAESFAEILRGAGFPNAKARQTAAIAGVPVKDGWMVNIHDTDSELGCVGVFYGRKHFKGYLEFQGYEDAAPEIARAFAMLLVAAREGWDWDKVFGPDGSPVAAVLSDLEGRPSFEECDHPEDRRVTQNTDGSIWCGKCGGMLFGPPREVPKDGDTILRSCRVCGCTQENCSQCVAKTGEPCYWVEEDLCSACVEPAGVHHPTVEDATKAHLDAQAERTAAAMPAGVAKVLQPDAADRLEANVRDKQRGKGQG